MCPIRADFVDLFKRLCDRRTAVASVSAVVGRGCAGGRGHCGVGAVSGGGKGRVGGGGGAGA